MRSILLRAFADHFAASTFETAYVEGNEASRRVSEKMGYSPNGSHTVIAQDGEPRIEHSLSIAAEDLQRSGEPVRVEGAGTFRRFLGLDPA